ESTFRFRVTATKYSCNTWREITPFPRAGGPRPDRSRGSVSQAHVYVRPYSVSRSDDGLRRSGALRFHRLNDRVGEFRGAGGAAYVPRELAAVAVDLVNRVADLHRSLIFTKVTQHEQGRSQHGS